MKSEIIFDHSTLEFLLMTALFKFLKLQKMPNLFKMTKLTMYVESKCIVGLISQTEVTHWHGI